MGVQIITDPNDSIFGKPNYGKQSNTGPTKFEFQPGDNVNFPKVGDEVTINYTGYLKNPRYPKHDNFIKSNDPFDSSILRNKPLFCKVGVGQLIRGWDEGILRLSLGQKATLSVTSDYGYGSSGFGAVIPPNSDLIFDVELIGINDLFINPPSSTSSEQQKQ
ncbi:unnamed protein product [Rhizophagus irregularis]|nr:unnamed protein product [Rhizophagus irregularis]CAB5328995.1 unnamed protein product [Rhizophagus irregularis]